MKASANSSTSLLPSLRRFGSLMTWSLHPLRWQAIRRLEVLRERHRGRRLFLLGNGPSLNRTDLSRLEGEHTLATNRFYLVFDRIRWRPTYYACVNELVLQQCADDFSRLACPKFLSWPARKYVRPEGETVLLRCHRDEPPRFSTDPRRGVWIGGTVTYVGLQLAYWMGYDEVVLLGVDHDFATKGPANRVIESSGDDPNHFTGDYFGKGFRWQLPDLELSEAAYQTAREAFERDRRRVVDATVGGKLEVFDKVCLEDYV